MLIDRTGQRDLDVPITIDQMPDDMLEMIFKNFSAQDVRNVECVNRRFHQLVADFRLWERLLENNARVRNLDLQGEVLIRYGFTPLQSTTSPRILALAADAACKASKNRMATILTLPAGWSLEQLERISQAAIDAGITSAGIFFWDKEPCRAPLLPLQEEQTVVLTNTVINGSRNKSPQVQAALLESKGFEPRFPDALIVLTMIVFTRIVTQGHRSLYHLDPQGSGNYTRCQQKTRFGSYLVVGGFVPSCATVTDTECDHPATGVGGLQKFVRGVRT